MAAVISVSIVLSAVVASAVLATLKVAAAAKSVVNSADLTVILVAVTVELVRSREERTFKDVPEPAPVSDKRFMPLNCAAPIIDVI